MVCGPRDGGNPVNPGLDTCHCRKKTKMPVTPALPRPTRHGQTIPVSMDSKPAFGRHVGPPEDGVNPNQPLTTRAS